MKLLKLVNEGFLKNNLVFLNESALVLQQKHIQALDKIIVVIPCMILETKHSAFCRFAHTRPPKKWTKFNDRYNSSLCINVARNKKYIVIIMV